MNMRDLEAFLAVVETGSIVGASARLHLTQPGVSRRIQTLEGLLGVALLDRQSKPLKPTAAGREAYEHGRRMLRALDDLRTGLSPDGAVRGEFRLGITPYLSEVAMTAPLDRLRGAFPDLTLCITTGWPEQLLEQLRRGEIDVAAFCLPSELDPPHGVEGYSFDLQPLFVVAARTSALMSPATLKDLSRLPWIINQDGCGFRSALRRRFEQEHLPLRVGVEALSSDLRLSLVARGVGITLATEAAIEGSPLHKKLKIVNVCDFKPKVRVWLVHRSPAGRLMKPIGCLGDALKAELETPHSEPTTKGPAPSIKSRRS
ncbi:DNA-binding transcriptional regulator, LysR family [Enhydrobacter aerosaccus]|uniref:DNA-binding transcriptional regulator, LysR family n=1 Tax=Enhydrobacter aerosaccus TaxID=225324 RepID=A0A1T4JZT6_9HYPH|nr:LysR family transcriptional regulator [Enhydrobacter aerosaccus]SJZ35690.1 DNA-binding transcriptional regulator, LysR family [Enhydrobacter aerosaccus]